MLISIRSLANKGFTLLEVLLVILVIGLMVAAVQVNFTSNKPEAQLRQESTRFAGVFNLAAEYSLMNNIDLGLVVKDNSYQFVGYDGVRWSSINDNATLSVYQLPEQVNIALVFDDLPIEEPTLIDAELFSPDDETIDLMEEDLEEGEKAIIPHVFLLSGGDITPFKAVFSMSSTIRSKEDIAFEVLGLYTSPVKLLGPIIDGELVGQDSDNE